MIIRLCRPPVGEYTGPGLITQQQGNCCNTRTVYGFDAYSTSDEVRNALSTFIRNYLFTYDEDLTYFDEDYGEFLHIGEEEYDADPGRYKAGGAGVWMVWIAADQIPMCHDPLLEAGFELIAQNIYNPNSGNVCNMYMGITPACHAMNEGQLPKSQGFRSHDNHDECAA